MDTSIVIAFSEAAKRTFNEMFGLAEFRHKPFSRLRLEGGLVGEMTNIIAGSAISSIHDLDIQIAPPVIVRGPNHKIGWPSIAPVIAITFALPSGSFEVDLCIRH